VKYFVLPGSCHTRKKTDETNDERIANTCYVMSTLSSWRHVLVVFYSLQIWMIL